MHCWGLVYVCMPWFKTTQKARSEEEAQSSVLSLFTKGHLFVGVRNKCKRKFVICFLIERLKKFYVSTPRTDAITVLD